MRLFSSILVMFLAAPASDAASAQGKKMAQEPAKPYRVLQKIPVPGDGGYDYLYLDEPSQRLYVSHGSEVAVLDATAGASIGVIAGVAGVHGISVVPEIGKGFITNGKSGIVTVFDPKTLKSTGEIKSTGKNPDALVYDPASRRLFVFNHGSGQVTAIDSATNEITMIIGRQRW